VGGSESICGIVRVTLKKFQVGEPDPQMGGPGPQWVGALYRHPEGAHNCGRIVTLSAAVKEKIEFL